MFLFVCRESSVGHWVSFNGWVLAVGFAVVCCVCCCGKSKREREEKSKEPVTVALSLLEAAKHTRHKIRLILLSDCHIQPALFSS